MGKRFTAKQQAFIDWYVILLNGTESARRAKYQGSDATLAAIAYENLRKPHIKQEIERRLSELTMTANEVLRRTSDIARADYSQYLKVDETGHVSVDVHQMIADGKHYLIKGIKETKYGQVVEFYDAAAAHDKIMRYHDLYNDSVRVKGWQDEIIEALRTGKLEPDDVKVAFPDLAFDFFKRAGLSVS